MRRLKRFAKRPVESTQLAVLSDGSCEAVVGGIVTNEVVFTFIVGVARALDGTRDTADGFSARFCETAAVENILLVETILIGFTWWSEEIHTVA